MILEDGPVYTPEQVSENGWLGPLTPAAIRKAVTRGDFECTRIRRKILFSRANILAIQKAGFEPTKQDRDSTPAPARRGRRTTPVDLPPGVPRLQARPERRRRKAS